MVSFSKLVNGLKPLAISTNSSIIDVYQGSECVTESATNRGVATGEPGGGHVPHADFNFRTKEGPTNCFTFKH